MKKLFFLACLIGLSSCDFSNIHEEQDVFRVQLGRRKGLRWGEMINVKGTIRLRTHPLLSNTYFIFYPDQMKYGIYMVWVNITTDKPPIEFGQELNLPPEFRRDNIQVILSGTYAFIPDGIYFPFPPPTHITKIKEVKK